MNKIKKLCTTILLAAILFGTAQSVEAKDYKEYFAANEIQKAIELDYIKPDKAGNVEPNKNITIGEFSHLVNIFLSISKKGEENFANIDEKYTYAKDLNIAKKSGYLKGKGDGTINPDNYITRGQAGAIIGELIGLRNDDPDYQAISWSADFKSLNDKDKPVINALVQAGYLKLQNGDSLNLNTNISKGELIYMLSRMTGNIVKEKTNIGSNLTGLISYKENITLKAPDIQLQNIDLQGDLIITEASGGKIVLKGCNVEGRILVLNAGEIEIYLENSEVGSLHAYNTSGITTVTRDEKSLVGDYFEGSSIKLTMKKAPDSAYGSGIDVMKHILLLIGIALLIPAVYLIRRRKKNKNIFINVGNVYELDLLPVLGNSSKYSIKNLDSEIFNHKIDTENLKVYLESLNIGRGRLVIQIDEKGNHNKYYFNIVVV